MVLCVSALIGAQAHYLFVSKLGGTGRSLLIVRGSFFMFVELGCISTNIEFTVP